MRVTRHPAPAHGVAWILFLLYTPLLHTSLTALHCPTIRAAAADTDKSSGSSDESWVWYVSGDQNCFAGGHISLAVAAIAVLIFLISAIPAVVLLSTHKMKSARLSSHLLVAPFSHMYRTHWEWWSGVELARRVVIVTFTVAFPANNYPVYFVLVVIVTVQAYIQPYKRRLHNILELAMSVNVLILILVRNTSYIESALQTYSAQPAASNEVGGAGGVASQCSDEIEGVTPFVVLLGVLFYVPLLVFLLLALVWTGNLLWSSSLSTQLKYHLSRSLLRKSQPPSVELSLSIRQPPRLDRAFATTTVDLEELAEATPPDDSLATGGGSRERVGSGGWLHQWVHTFRRRLSSAMPISPMAKSPLPSFPEVTKSTRGAPSQPPEVEDHGATRHEKRTATYNIVELGNTTHS